VYSLQQYWVMCYALKYTTHYYEYVYYFYFMFTKFERNSDRVKSISFHPHRPWLLSALHSGTIELIDYRIKKRLATYEDHQGAVRTV
jgi:WD40 repeat protein